MNRQRNKEPQNVFLVGAGLIGRNIIQQVLELDNPNNRKIIGIANSKQFLVKANGISTQNFRNKVPGDINDDDIGRLLGGGNSYSMHNEIVSAVKDEIGGNVVFVDVTDSGTLMTEFHKGIIRKRAHGIVTANKLPLARSMETFNELTKDCYRYRLNTSVMAGAGAVDYLRSARNIGEIIESMEGVFSGTLAYICSELEKGRKFSEIVKEAKNKGYTEPHPINDLNGEDVRRKLLILLRSAGISIEAVDIALDGFIDTSKYQGIDVVDFLQEIEGEDESIKKLLAPKLAKGMVPRYVASYKEKEGKMVACVGLQFVPKDSELGSLKGTANKVIIYSSQRAPLKLETPFEVKAAGAGDMKTAASVRADLDKILFINQ